ncbi:MAG: methyltransferase domain-containing protein [Acidimicrobiales bacterium]
MSVAYLRTESGSILPLEVDRWQAPPAPEDLDVLHRAWPPVLDIGCGPGRHSLALALRAVLVLGIDASPAAVSLARSRGAPVLLRSVFDPVPGAGRWRTALLLDGNIGICGDPAAMLGRVAELLAPGGKVLAELGPPGEETRSHRVRIERDDQATPWFPWATVGADAVWALAAASGFCVDEVWHSGDRWFAQLAR